MPLQELVPGAEQKVWVQSQTTFAQLHKEEDGSWVVRVVKQKIWVAGVSYELQVRGPSFSSPHLGGGFLGGGSVRKFWVAGVSYGLQVRPCVCECVGGWWWC